MDWRRAAEAVKSVNLGEKLKSVATAVQEKRNEMKERAAEGTPPLSPDGSDRSGEWSEAEVDIGAGELPPPTFEPFSPGGGGGAPPQLAPRTAAAPAPQPSRARVPMQDQSREQLLETAVKFGQRYKTAKARADALEAELEVKDARLAAADGERRVEVEGLMEMVQLLQDERRANGAVEVNDGLRAQVTKLKAEAKRLASELAKERRAVVASGEGVAGHMLEVGGPSCARAHAFACTTCFCNTGGRTRTQPCSRPLPLSASNPLPPFDPSTQQNTGSSDGRAGGLPAQRRGPGGRLGCPRGAA